MTQNVDAVYRKTIDDPFEKEIQETRLLPRNRGWTGWRVRLRWCRATTAWMQEVERRICRVRRLGDDWCACTGLPNSKGQLFLSDMRNSELWDCRRSFASPTVPSMGRSKMSISRRTFVRSAVGGAVVSTGFGTAMMTPRRVRAALPPQTFFSSPAAAISAVLGTDEAPLSAAVEIKIPSMVEVADMVPVTVMTTLDNIESITIVADDNPNPIIAYYRFSPQLWPYLATRVRLAKSGNVHALVKAKGTVHRATKHIDISIGGCGDPEPGPQAVPPAQSPAMSHKILIRTKKSDEGLIFRALITHPMTPPFKDAKTGLPTAGYFIQEVKAQVNDKPVINGDWSAGVARDPYLSFKIRQVAQGDVIRLTWSDSAGGSASSEVVVG